MPLYISLGYNCSPRGYIKHTLGITKGNGYLSCPFDLCITPFESLYKCIETDFKYFFDDLRLIPGMCADGRPSNDVENKQNITNYYNIIFNHEGSTHSHLFDMGKNDDLFYIRNDFEKFKERYSARINNFRNYMKEYDHIIFIINYMEYPTNSDHTALLKLLKEVYHDKNIEIQVYNHY